MTRIGRKASNYEQTGPVQKRASNILMDMLDISGQSNVLDLGCGSGGATKNIAALTKGRVQRVDISEGMINEARRCSKGLPNLDFLALFSAGEHPGVYWPETQGVIHAAQQSVI